jgi:endonuclease/exonuclease/phosphatase family metal-dependent hydrolase
LASIDHVFLSAEFAVRRVEVMRTRLTRVASDHYPLVVELELPGLTHP